MKKIFMMILAALLVLGMGTAVYAEEESVVTTPLVIVDDSANLLDEEEEEKLRAYAEKIANKYTIRIGIVTKDEYVSSARSDAEDYYIENMTEFTDGILMYLNMDERDMQLLTSGSLEIAVSNSYGVDYFLDATQDNFSDEEYYEGFDTYLRLTDKFVKEALENEPYSSSHPYRTAFDIVFRIVCALIAGCVLSYLVMISMKKSMNTVRKQQLAKEYVTKEGLVLFSQYDKYLYRRVTRKAIPKSTSSGGSSHRSSGGGSSFGGGGRKF